MNKLIVCPNDKSNLIVDTNHAYCNTCNSKYRIDKNVFCFLESTDLFYEGKYINKTKWLPPINTKFFIIPLMVNSQGYISEVLKQIPKNAVVAEIGSAGGIDYFGNAFKMIGVDLSKSSLVAATNYQYRLMSNALSLPIANQCLDGIISSCFFEHLDNHGKVKFLQECHRTLKQNGKLVFFYDIKTENPIINYYKKKNLNLYNELFLIKDGHIGYDSIENNSRLFMEAGFKITETVCHDLTLLIGNSCWQKFLNWDGPLGLIAKIMQKLSNGVMRYPYLTLQFICDRTLGNLLPKKFARCVTTVAIKQ